MQCAKKRACGLVYLPFLCVCQTTWFGTLSVCRMEGKWAGRGIEDHEVHDGDAVKGLKVGGATHVTFNVIWNRVVCMS